jgi:ketosteroid isomerase-like protein
MREAAQAWSVPWEWVRVHSARFLDAGEHVLVELPTSLKGKGSGVEVATDNFGVFTVRDSKIVRIEFLTDRAAAVRAANLDEIDLVRLVGDAVAAGDMETVSLAMHPDVVWEHNIGVGSPEEGVYRGREEVVGLLRRILDAWEYMRVEPDEIRDLGDGRFLVRGSLRAKHRATQSELDTPYEQRFDVRDGLLTRGRMTVGQERAGSGSGNVDAVRRFVDAFNRSEHVWLSDLDPDVELREWPTAPGAAIYHGVEGVKRAVDEWFESWEWMEVRIADIFEAGDHVIVTLDQRAKGRGSAIEVEITSFNVYTFRDGKVVRIALFTEREPALAAAGLTESHQEESR